MKQPNDTNSHNAYVDANVPQHNAANTRRTPQENVRITRKPTRWASVSMACQQGVLFLLLATQEKLRALRVIAVLKYVRCLSSYYQ